MTHFSVAVFHREDQDIDDLLAPYDEGIRVAPYVTQTKEEALEDARKYDFNKDASDEELWACIAGSADAVDEEGNIYSTYNPSSKWDYYTEIEEMSVQNLKADYSTFAVVLPDGRWIEPGEVGWWGMTTATKDDMEAWYKSYKERFIDKMDPDMIVTTVDCHI